MARKRHSDEDFLELLREIELKLSADDDIASAAQDWRAYPAGGCLAEKFGVS